jgi:hypothetical protein
MREPTYFVLASLLDGPLHGYAIIQRTKELSGSRVRLVSTDAQGDDVGDVDGEDAGAGKGPAGGFPAGPWCAWWRLGGQSAVTSAAAVRAADSSTMALRLA